MKFVIGLFLGDLLIDMSTLKELKHFPSAFFPTSFLSSPARGVSDEACHPYLLTWLTLKGLPSLNSSADKFSGSDEHLSLQLECIQACSHFVKGALGWEKESSNCFRYGQNSFTLTTFSVQDKMARLKY